MCPSYMATHEEEDTTRARANMLRSVLDGTLAPEELTGQRMKEVMDLCVGCKACKSECPSGVDVASMKTEVLYQTGTEHGFTLRQKGAGHVRTSLGLASKMPRLYNAVAATGLARKAASLAGIDPRRNLPRVTERTFSRRFPSLPQGDGPELALFNDTWNEYQRPEIGEGAVRVLAASGARVSLPEVVCCGRPMLSEGLVEPARENARRNLDLLTPLIDAGIPLVGLEPSCILTMRDDYAKLLPGDERVAKLAGLTRLFEEALLELIDAGAEPRFEEPQEGPPVLLHGHCHQKALVGTGPMERALALSGARVRTVDSGCCGMAGLFGYEKGHYEASMKMGERRLLPAVREHEGGEVVAPGTSCREQISDGASRIALHPAEYLAARLPR
jgi:Fe-S oxidoreductase